MGPVLRGYRNMKEEKACGFFSRGLRNQVARPIHTSLTPRGHTPNTVSAQPLKTTHGHTNEPYSLHFQFQSFKKTLEKKHFPRNLFQEALTQVLPFRFYPNLDEKGWNKNFPFHAAGSSPRFYHHKLKGCPGPPAWLPSLPPDGFPVGPALVSFLAVHWDTWSHLLFAQNEDNVAFYPANMQYCTVAWVFFLLRILLEIIVKVKIFKLPFSSSCIEVLKKIKSQGFTRNICHAQETSKYISMIEHVHVNRTWILKLHLMKFRLPKKKEDWKSFWWKKNFYNPMTSYT